MYENINISNEIREYRIKKGITQEELAEKSNLSVNYISKLETGQRNNISINKLFSICNALDISISKIVGDDINNTLSEYPQSTIRLLQLISKLSYSDQDLISKDLIPLITDFLNKK